MPVRATKRGAERTPLDRRRRRPRSAARRFAGLAVARELAGSGARVLMVDRYEIGERQTSACAAPTRVARAPGPEGVDPADVRRARDPHAASATLPLAAAVDRSRTFDYRELCALLRGAGRRASSRRRRSSGRTRDDDVVHTDRGDLRAPLIVDALGWRRVLGARRARSSRPTRGSRAGWRSTRAAAARTSSSGSTARTCRAGYGWCVPGRRRGARRRRLVRPALPREGADGAAGRATSAFRRRASRATGSRTSCAPRPRTASSSSATAPATACPRPPRASAPRCTSA